MKMKLAIIYHILRPRVKFFLAKQLFNYHKLKRRNNLCHIPHLSFT